MTTSPVMTMLARGVPLTLLLGLADPAGPDSMSVNAVERPPGDPILLRPLLGSLCTVEAAWDLTEVERLVLGQRP